MDEHFFELRTVCPMGQCPVTVQGKPCHGEFEIVDCSRWRTGHSCHNECAAQVSLEHALELARRVQEMLQPQPRERFPGLTAASWMSVSQRVGGDFQAVHCNHDRVLAIQGDVMGKGVNAALLAAYLVGLFDALAQTRACLPEMLEELNRRVYHRTRRRPMFATALLIEARIADRTWSFGRAGHEPPMLVRAGGDFDILECHRCLPLGVETGECYGTWCTSLDPGDQLLAMTDGSLEVGLSYEQALGLMRAYPGPDVLDELAASIKSSPPYRDDVSLLWLGVDPSL